MKSVAELSELAEEMLALESENFEIEDYAGPSQMMGDQQACSSSSTCSSTSTSCSTG